jgi:hypothetical protein
MVCAAEQHGLPVAHPGKSPRSKPRAWRTASVGRRFEDSCALTDLNRALKAKAAPASRSLYSLCVRSLPASIVSMNKSKTLAQSGPGFSGMSSSIRRSFALARAGLRMARKILVASASGQSWITCMIR